MNTHKDLAVSWETRRSHCSMRDVHLDKVVSAADFSASNAISGDFSGAEVRSLRAFADVAPSACDRRSRRAGYSYSSQEVVADINIKISCPKPLVDMFTELLPVGSA